METANNNNSNTAGSNLNNQNPSLILFLIISLVLLALGFIVNRALRKQIIETRSSELESIAQLKVNQLNDFRNERLSEAEFLEGNQTFIKTVNNFRVTGEETYFKEIYDWLAPIKNNHHYKSISIFDPVTNRPIIHIDSEDNIWDTDTISIKGIRQCLNEGKIITGDLTKKQGEILLPFYIPLIQINGSDTNQIGVVEFILDPSMGLYDIMQSMPARGSTGEILVVRREGDDVVFLNELRFKQNTSLTFKLPLNTPELPAARAILGNEDASIGIDYRGHKVLAVSKIVPAFNWSVVVKKDTSEILQALRMREILIYSTVLLLIVSIGLIFRHLSDRRNLSFYIQRTKDLNTITRLSKLFKLLNSVERAIVKNTDRNILLNEICNIIFNEGNYALCWVGIRNESTGIMDCLVECGIEKSIIPPEIYLRNLEISATRKFVSNNVLNDSRLGELRESLKIENYGSMAVFPLAQNSKLVGTVNIFTYEPGYFKSDEIELLSGLCEDLSYALDKIDLEKREMESKQNLIEKERQLKLNEQILIEQNKELVVLNDKYLCANESLRDSNDRIKKVNQDLILAREKAEESDRLKSAFVANLSHEIRSPMNAIIGFAELMNSHDLSKKEIKEFTSIIILKSNELLHLINDILDVSKIESNTVTLFFENISLGKFLDEIQTVFIKRLDQTEKSHILLNSVKYPSGDLEISSDVIKLKQIFNNLLENAIKFTDKGKIEYGYLNHTDEHLTFFVKDTGIGIDAKYKDNIFEIFRQAENDLKRNYGGTGLGLAICKGNANLLGGDIWVESEPNKGSTFIFTIHRGRKKDGIENKPDRKARRIIQDSKKNILLVEDDYYSVEYLKRLFENRIYNLSIARNGKETKNYFKKLHEFDLVLLDMRLPDADGIDLVKQIKALQGDLPVIAQTAFATEEDRRKCLDAGCDEFITKPFKPGKIISMIESILAKELNNDQSQGPDHQAG